MYAGTSPHLRFGPPRCTFPPTFRSPNLAIFTKICHIVEPQIWQNLKMGKLAKFWTPKSGGVPPLFWQKMGGSPPENPGGDPPLFWGFWAQNPQKRVKKGQKRPKKAQK